jgi:hypothetical protein
MYIEKNFKNFLLISLKYAVSFVETNILMDYKLKNYLHNVHSSFINRLMLF